MIQGGNLPELRRECAQRLMEIGFDGYGFGGWPIGSDGRLVDMVGFVAELVPPDLPLHGLGIGKPENLVQAYRQGYGTFDCVLPTRDGRHRRLYRFREPLHKTTLEGNGFYEFLYLDHERSRRNAGPIEEGCDCPVCRQFSRAYLHHLNRIGDPLARRLATLHNLRFFTRLVEELGRRSSVSNA